jgi:carboxyl-terminal processing protease
MNPSGKPFSILSRPAWLAALAFAAVTAGAAETRPGAADPKRYEPARLLVQRLAESHLSHRPADAVLVRRMLELYLDSIDSQRIFFCQVDAEAIFAMVPECLAGLTTGDITAAQRIFANYRSQLDDFAAYAERRLQLPFDFTTSRSWILNRDRVAWPAGMAARSQAWDDYLQHQVLLQLEKSMTDPKSVQPEPAVVAAATAAVHRHIENFIEEMRQYDTEMVAALYLNALARAYDPHSDYLAPADKSRFDTQLNLSLTGIGIEYDMIDGVVTVSNVMKGSPAERGGLKTGDRIVGIQEKDGVMPLHNTPRRQLSKLFRGVKGSEIVLQIRRADVLDLAKTEMLTLVRDEICLEDRRVSWRRESIFSRGWGGRQIGIIDVPSFYVAAPGAGQNGQPGNGVTADVQDSLQSLRSAGTDGIILDLRGNGGGALNEAIRLVSLFVDNGPVVQVLEGRTLRILSNRNSTVAYRGPLIVLIDRLSASASEIVAGALKDYGRALVVGDVRTFGKGTVQSVLQLGKNPELGSFKTTTAMFFRINGDSTQLHGVGADLVLDSPVSALPNLGEEHSRYPYPWLHLPPRFYDPLAGLATRLPSLAARSEERRGAESAYRQYLDLVSAMADRFCEGTAALNYQNRVLEVRLRQQWQALHMPKSVPVARETERNAAADPVLDETVKVMADLIDMNHGTKL